MESLLAGADIGIADFCPCDQQGQLDAARMEADTAKTQQSSSKGCTVQ